MSRAASPRSAPRARHSRPPLPPTTPTRSARSTPGSPPTRAERGRCRAMNRVRAAVRSIAASRSCRESLRDELEGLLIPVEDLLALVAGGDEEEVAERGHRELAGAGRVAALDGGLEGAHELLVAAHEDGDVVRPLGAAAVAVLDDEHLGEQRGGRRAGARLAARSGADVGERGEAILRGA